MVANNAGTPEDSATDKTAFRHEEEVIDLDLKMEDTRLREAVGKPTAIKMPDGVVVHFDHVADWSSAAMRAASKGDWESWGGEVIHDDEELSSFVDADLANYQMEAVFEKCTDGGQMNRGKSKRSRK
jgi:hypothetical protein